ncbi:MAG: ATP-binding protein [Clostridia bacterium]|nr:ATP-binding protein [Clostridia bacterium]
MADTILNDLLAEYARQRELDEQENQRREQAAIARCPEIGKLMQQRQQLIFAGVQGILHSGMDFSATEKKMALANDRINALLVQNGFPADWLEPVYRCKTCRDTGYTGEPIREMCPCLKNAYYQKLYQKVGLHEAQEQSFEKFDASVFSDRVGEGMPFSQREAMEMIREACEQFADTAPAARYNTMLLMGKSGLGKTFLMHAMTKRLIDRGVNTLLISAFRLQEMTRKAYVTGDQSGVEDIMSASVLMIDDLGTEPLMENITVTQLYNIINERINANMCTVISTNFSEEELRKRYTERITSRLLDKRHCQVVKFIGDDIRMKA